MTQDEIMDMARQAGFEKVIYINPNTGIKTIQAYDSNSLEAFAKLVAAKERYACMNICLNFADVNSGPDGIEQDYHAKLIAARGEA